MSVGAVIVGVKAQAPVRQVEATTNPTDPSWARPTAIGAGVAIGLGGLAIAMRGTGPLRVAGAAVAAIAGAALLSGCAPTNPSAARGSSPDAVVDSILKHYDHSENGQIDLDSASGLPKDDERLRVQVRQRSETQTDWDPNDEDFLPFGNPWGDSSTTRWDERRLIGGHQIFTAANENRDRTVTRSELLDLVKQYDDFGDGKLGTGELEAFRADNPEEFDVWTRIG